jgi:radical SAM protein with 4Fe4S-binding SPASM domain
MARDLISPNSVSALVTTTKASLQMPEAIVDEYVRLGFDEIFVRPLAQHGFAKRNAPLMGYSSASFHDFYNRCFDRIMWWNRKGTPLREASAAIWFNKLLSPFDAGYVDLQSPTGAGSAVLVYNYDGYVYPSDEARMLTELGNTSLRLGRIGDSLRQLTQSEVVYRLRDHSNGKTHPECGECPYNTMCGPDPVDAMTVDECVPVQETDHCRRSKWMFSNLLNRFDDATSSGDEHFLDLAHAWARRTHPRASRLTNFGYIEGKSFPFVGSVDTGDPAPTRGRFIPIREFKEVG